MGVLYFIERDGYPSGSGFRSELWVSKRYSITEEYIEELPSTDDEQCDFVHTCSEEL